MGKFWRDCKGAVTVFVSLLLIPAILITGTGVDLARIYTARSIVQDANQLAANSVLASYDALLQDLYGLFGFMKDSEEIGNMVKSQIELAIKGQEGVGDHVGSGQMLFKLFDGSNLQPGTVSVADGHNLGSPPILRRQIEEYSKFRVPVIIANELVGKLDTFKTLQEDAKVIKKKMEVDDGVEELDKWYRKVYNCIVELNTCVQKETDASNDAHTASDDIHGKLSDLSEWWGGYLAALKAKKEAEKELEKAEAALAAVAEEDEVALAAAQEAVQKASDALKSAEMALQDARAGYEMAANALATRSKTWKDKRDELIEELEHYIDLFEDSGDGLKYLCKKADEAKVQLTQKIQELENSLGGGCSDDLKKGLTEPIKRENGGEEKSVIDSYKDLTKYNLSPMAAAMADNTGITGFEGDIKQINETIQHLKDASLGSYNLVEFGEMGADGITAAFPLPEDEHTSNPYASILHSKLTPEPIIADPGFQMFQASLLYATKNGEFYEELHNLYRSGKGDELGKKNVKNTITNLFKAAKSIFTDLTDPFEGFNPEGAKHLSGGTNTSDPSTGSKFGTNSDYDWSSEDGGKDELQDSLDSDFLSLLGDLGNKIGNKILLVAYDTEMFSNYTTTGQERPKLTTYPETNMAGVKLSTEVNYYFQSEVEYLYNGNLADAVDNLKSVAGMIFLIRFVFDYVASFSISEVNTVVNTVKSVLSWTGPFAILTSELARLAIALGESVMDVQRLRTGERVDVYKSNETWTFSLSGLARMFAEEVTENTIKESMNADSIKSSEEETERGLSYLDYLRLFLLLVDGDTLARRTANLIELNITNYRWKLGANEDNMASAERFDLSKASTDFTITTKVDMRMLFLSMPFAQKGINSVVPPKTFPISATDYRGY